MVEYIITKIGKLPKLGLGTFSVHPKKLQEILPVALDLGYSLFDTANKYQNEHIMGNILSKYHRQSYCLETKVHAELLLGNLRYFRLNRKTVNSAFNNACKQLQTNFIDVFMIHSAFRGCDIYLKKVTDLKFNGKIGYVGLCNVSLDQLEMLEQKRCLPDIVQVEIHPYHSNVSLIEFCHSHDIVVEARSPFAHGDAMMEWLKEPLLQDVANIHHASIPQVILRWMTQQDIIALPRTQSIQHLKDNIDSFGFSLSRDEIDAIHTLNRNKSYGYVSSSVV